MIIPTKAKMSAPLAPLSSYRRVQNLDSLNTASITATIYKQDGKVQTTFNATVNPYRSVLIDNGSLSSGMAGSVVVGSSSRGSQKEN